MSQIHNALSRGPLGKAIKASVGDQTTESNLERWGETLTPSIDPWSMPEWAFLRQERLAAGPFDVTGAAGTIPEVLLFNPPNTKLLGVVMHIRWAWNTAGGQFAYRLYRGAALPAGFVAVNTGPIDTRDPKLIAAPASGLVLAQAANAAVSGGLAFDSIQVGAGVVIEDFDPVILAPGTGLAFGPIAVGVQRFIGGIHWRERVAFASELGF